MNNEIEFDCDLAVKIGLHGAVIITILDELIKNNPSVKYRSKNWITISINDLQKHIPFFSKTKIEYILKKLRASQFVFAEKINNTLFDTTLSYSINTKKIKGAN